MANVILFHQNLLIDIHSLQLAICKKINGSLGSGFCAPYFPLYVEFENSAEKITGINLNEIRIEQKCIYIEVLISCGNEKSVKKLIVAKISSEEEKIPADFPQFSMNTFMEEEIANLIKKILKPIRVFKTAELILTEEDCGQSWKITSEKWVKLQ